MINKQFLIQQKMFEYEITKFMGTLDLFVQVGVSDHARK